MTLPLVIWIPAGAVTLSVAALLWSVVVAWMWARPGDGLFHPRGAWFVHWSGLAVLASVTLLMVGCWWEVGPL